MSAADSATRLDVWLAEERGVSRPAARALIDAGLVTVNGRSAKAGQKIAATDVVDVAAVAEPPKPAPVAAPEVALTVVYEDDDLAVIDKPAGMVVHPAPGHPHGTLADGLRQRGSTWSLVGGEERPGIVHRLDRDTSGLLVVAKTETAHRALALQLSKRTLRRTYWALVHGVVEEDTATIDAPIGRDAKDRKKMAVIEGGRDSITNFEVIERFRGHTALSVSLQSGRTHQIRVHLAYIRKPVVGDPLYGPSARGPLPPFWRLALHATELEFVHPTTQELRRFESLLPEPLLSMRDAAQNGSI